MPVHRRQPNAAVTHRSAPRPVAKKKPCVKPGCAQKAAQPPAGGVTRASCLECVEKHLGAAWVLLAETRAGYPHRLRAIGHLHEAEDESQEWPSIHTAIRESRKLYQSESKIPDFERLAALLAEAFPAVGNEA